MVTIRKEKLADVAAREALLDKAYGIKPSFPKLPNGCAKVACRQAGCRWLRPITVSSSAQCGYGMSPQARAATRCCWARSRFTPDRRNRGIGTALMRRAIARARLADHGAILLVGDAAYYGRFGFSTVLTRDLWMPGEYERDQLLALQLEPGALAGARGPISARLTAGGAEVRLRMLIAVKRASGARGGARISAPLTKINAHDSTRGNANEELVCCSPVSTAPS